MENEELLPQTNEEDPNNPSQTKPKPEKKKKDSSIGSIIGSLFGSGDDEESNYKGAPEYDPSLITGSDNPDIKIRYDAKPDNETTVHVMSIASGHLYERFLRIMMLTTLKNTNAKHIKFWFFGQFLSPKFKQFIPYFMSKYNCSIELISYRWPEWLRQPTENKE